MKPVSKERRRKPSGLLRWAPAAAALFLGLHCAPGTDGSGHGNYNAEQATQFQQQAKTLYEKLIEPLRHPPTKAAANAGALDPLSLCQAEVSGKFAEPGVRIKSQGVFDVGLFKGSDGARPTLTHQMSYCDTTSAHSFHGVLGEIFKLFPFYQGQINDRQHWLARTGENAFAFQLLASGKLRGEELATYLSDEEFGPANEAGFALRSNRAATTWYKTELVFVGTIEKDGAGQPADGGEAASGNGDWTIAGTVALQAFAAPLDDPDREPQLDAREAKLTELSFRGRGEFKFSEEDFREIAAAPPVPGEASEESTPTEPPPADNATEAAAAPPPAANPAVATVPGGAPASVTPRGFQAVPPEPAAATPRQPAAPPPPAAEPSAPASRPAAATSPVQLRPAAAVPSAPALNPPAAPRATSIPPASTPRSPAPEIAAPTQPNRRPPVGATDRPLDPQLNDERERQANETPATAGPVSAAPPAAAPASIEPARPSAPSRPAPRPRERRPSPSNGAATAAAASAEDPAAAREGENQFLRRLEKSGGPYQSNFFAADDIKRQCKKYGAFGGEDFHITGVLAGTGALSSRIPPQTIESSIIFCFLPQTARFIAFVHSKDDPAGQYIPCEADAHLAKHSGGFSFQITVKRQWKLPTDQEANAQVEVNGTIRRLGARNIAMDQVTMNTTWPDNGLSLGALLPEMSGPVSGSATLWIKQEPEQILPVG
jgi:hypothetical protein